MITLSPHSLGVFCSGIPALAFLGNAGLGEITLVLLVLLLLFGARRLPEFARSLGRAIAELRRAGNDFSRDFIDSGDESPQPPDTAETDKTVPSPINDDRAG